MVGCLPRNGSPTPSPRQSGLPVATRSASAALGSARTNGRRSAMTKTHFVWHDLNTTARAAAQRFYGELFNWKFAGDAYAHVKAGAQMLGGIRTIGPTEHLPP